MDCYQPVAKYGKDRNGIPIIAPPTKTTGRMNMPRPPITTKEARQKMEQCCVGGFKRGVRKAVYEKDRGECVYCAARTLLTVDHLKPKSQGGEKTVDNLVLACVHCNHDRADGPHTTLKYGWYRVKAG